jgi:replicative DNA helicase
MTFQDQLPDVPQLAPHSIEAEEAVLGSLLIAPDVLDDLGFLMPDDFFIVKHAWIFEAIRAVNARKDQVDYLTVSEELREKERLNECGGVPYLTYVLNHTPTAVYAETYARIVERAAVRRRLLAASSEIARLAYSEQPADEALDAAEKTISSIRENRRDGTIHTERIADVASEYWDITEKTISEAGCIPTGLVDLDRILAGGLKKGDYTLIAGRPGQGKTSLMLTIARNAARAKKHVLMFSFEMTNQQLTARLMAMESGIPTNQQKADLMGDGEWDRFASALSTISDYSIQFDKTFADRIETMIEVIRRVEREHPLDLIIVDYLQLMVAPKSENRNHELGYISRNLKKIAMRKGYEVNVLAGAQLSRDIEKRANKRPLLSDLRDSGNLEQDADQVIFLHQDENKPENKNTIEAHLAKARNGDTGMVELYFARELTLFNNLKRDTIPLNAPPKNGQKEPTPLHAGAKD